MYGCKSDHRSNASHKEEIDVENGDLSAWEYLTANFDDDEFLQEHNGTAKNGVDITSNVFMQDAILSFDERLCYSCPHFYRQSKDVTGEGMLTNFLIGKQWQRISIGSHRNRQRRQLQRHRRCFCIVLSM